MRQQKDKAGGVYMFRTFALVLVISVGAAAPSWAGAGGGSGPQDWGQADRPTHGITQVIGTPAAGCLAGAKPLDLDGDGYEVLRPQRHRYFGSPKLLKFIQWLGHQASLRALGTLLVGDMSQPRGGPMLYGHGSHQNGLDVDIMFEVAQGPISAAERSDPEIPSVVKDQGLDPGHWTQADSRILEIAARSPDVERIFVNPAIKLALCRQTPMEDRSWLRKLRPWWGHDDHFHIRLGCPEGSPGCKAQKPPPEGDGCGYEVVSWLERPTLAVPLNKPNTRRVALPSACGKVLHAR